MKYTENLYLNLPEDGDRFDINDMNDNMEKLDAAAGGLKIVKCTQEEYDALESPDENTVYYAVDDNGKVKHYLGGMELSGGSGAPQQASVAATNLTTVMGIARTEEVN